MESPNLANGIVLGDTGDHHFPKSHSNSDRRIIDSEELLAVPGADLLLSEIAEEDLISMMSDSRTGNNSRSKREVIVNKEVRQS